METSRKPRKIVIENIKGVRLDGIVTNQPVEMTDQYMEAIAESILQVLYNLGLHSNVELNYDMKIEGGTKYMTHGTEVYVVPTHQDPYSRRIRNNNEVIKPK